VSEPTPLSNPLQDPAAAGRWRVDLPIVLLLLILASLVRLPWLADHGYQLDELWTAELATGRGSAHQHLPTDTLLQPVDVFRLDDAPPCWHVWTHMECTHPPLYFLTLRFWMMAFGQGDGRERLLSVICSLIAIALLYDTARLLNGRAVAIWACVLMCESNFSALTPGESPPCSWECWPPC
jgi:hypothetical protein